jgi:hypothetical protein
MLFVGPRKVVHQHQIAVALAVKVLGSATAYETRCPGNYDHATKVQAPGKGLNPDNTAIVWRATVIGPTLVKKKTDVNRLFLNETL